MGNGALHIRFEHLGLIFRICTSALCPQIARGRVKRKGTEQCQISTKRQQIIFLLTLPLNAAPYYLGTQGTRANLIDKARLLKSYRQGTLVQIVSASHNCVNIIDKAQLRSAS